MNRSPDVEALFEFIGTKKRSVIDGYRPAHLIKDGYLTTGIHHYYDGKPVPAKRNIKRDYHVHLPRSISALFMGGQKNKYSRRRTSCWIRHNN